jgi:hypothetical protein
VCVCERERERERERKGGREKGTQAPETSPKRTHRDTTFHHRGSWAESIIICHANVHGPCIGLTRSSIQWLYLTQYGLQYLLPYKHSTLHSMDCSISCHTNTLPYTVWTAVSLRYTNTLPYTVSNTVALAIQTYTYHAIQTYTYHACIHFSVHAMHQHILSLSLFFSLSLSPSLSEAHTHTHTHLVPRREIWEGVKPKPRGLPDVCDQDTVEAGM